MSLFASVRARREDVAPVAAPVAPPPRRCAPDALLGYLRMLIRQHRAAPADAADARPNGFALFYVQLRRSDRISALAGEREARQALETICERIAATMGTRGHFAVQGVDELLIVMPEVGNPGIAILESLKLAQSITPSGPIDGDGLGQVRAAASVVHPAIGCALFPQHGGDEAALMAAADRACRTAHGRQEGYAIAERASAQRKNEDLTRDIERAIVENKLEVFLQPQYDLRTQTFSAAEALIRWIRPQGEPFVSPLDIVDVAERRGLMPDLTKFVIDTVLRQSAILRKGGIDLKIAVNISAASLTEPGLPELVHDQLALWEVPANRLTLEVTEGTLMQEVDLSIATMHALKEIGTDLSMDDFGTGYSSLAYLRRMPIDELKIDQLFIRNLAVREDGTVEDKSRSDLGIVRSIIGIARNFDLHTVAEGVEDLNSLNLLQGLGCDIIQGYYTCRPMPIAKIAGWWDEKGRTGIA